MDDLDYKPDIKLFSVNALLLAGFFGGPLATGIISYINFKSLKEQKMARKELLIGISLELLLLIMAFIITAHSTTEYYFLFLLPFICVIYLRERAKKIFWKYLEKTSKIKRPLYSFWEAALIGLLCSIVSVSAIKIYESIETFDFKPHTIVFENSDISENEKLADEYLMRLNNKMDSISYNNTADKAILYLKKNVQNTNSIDYFQNLTSEQRTENQLYRNYCNLLIRKIDFMKKAKNENSSEYNSEIEQLDQFISEYLSTKKPPQLQDTVHH